MEQYNNGQNLQKKSKAPPATLFICVMVVISQAGDLLSPMIVTIGALGYFITNSAHAYYTNNLTAKRVLEYGMIAIICEFLMLNYVL
jgi:hypothetical protein